MHVYVEHKLSFLGDICLKAEMAMLFALTETLLPPQNTPYYAHTISIFLIAQCKRFGLKVTKDKVSSYAP